jgi:hypothetical protein
LTYGNDSAAVEPLTQQATAINPAPSLSCISHFFSGARIVSPQALHMETMLNGNNNTNTKTKNFGK